MTLYETPIVALDEFLAPMELNALHAYAAMREADFTPSQVIGQDRDGLQDPQHRRSRVLYDVDGFHDILGARIIHFLPFVLYRLGLAPFAVSGIELQLTASNDGEFFHAHTDSDDGPVRGRTVTFVYFCHREPCAFQGGELRVYGRDPASGADLADVWHVIRPAQNRIVFFPSDRLHEITPVACPTRAFLDSRLTLNGWLHR
jgi:Rps23 Pro-64 3,4-dihydroxylase Tpa1-like proline 4-hydroxylase